MINKFPEIFWKKKRLVWDYRQDSNPGDLLFVRGFLSEAQKTKLIEKHSKLEKVEESESCRFSEIVSDYYDRPTQKMKVVGVTGSNGKSSTCYYGAQLCSISGKKSAVIGSLGVMLLENNSSEIKEFIQTGFTSPDVVELQQAFSLLQKNGVEVVFVEVSSHALSLDRVGGVDFDCGVYLNLTRDHLDFHKDFESYFQAKKLLFSKYLKASTEKDRSAVICRSNEHGERLYSDCSNKLPKIFSFKKDESYKILDRTVEGIFVSGDVFLGFIKIPFLGDFNVENIVAAILSVRSLGIMDKLTQQVASKIKPLKGRMHLIESCSRRFVVDYAHTPDALEKALRSLKRFIPLESSLLVVFGCGGDRDTGKRSEMGKIAAQLADKIIVTSDNPRTEDPQKIIDDIASGIDRYDEDNLCFEADRRKAIKLSVEKTHKGDVILVAGKGHEDYQIIGTQKFHFDDVEEILAVNNLDNL